MRINAGIFLDSFLAYTTYKFNKNLYLGCPLNALIHFEKYYYDEIFIIENKDYVNSFDILNLKKISEASMKPKCYGGGIRNINQAKAIIEVGYERISLRSIYFQDLNEFRRIILLLGRQSVTLCLDIKKFDNHYYVCLNNKLIIRVDEFNINESDIPGEILINNMDLNGTLSGIDLELIEIIANKMWNTNLNYCGGVNSIYDIDLLVQFNFTAATLFSRAATINNGSDKLLNNTVFYEKGR